MVQPLRRTNGETIGTRPHASFNTAAPHDSQVFEELLVEGNEAVYADSAFQSKRHAERLKQLGMDNRIHEKAYRNKPLTQTQKHNNRTRSTIRNSVERVFGQFKRHMGLGIAKYLGMARNALRACMIYLCHNLKTARCLLKLSHPKSV